MPDLPLISVVTPSYNQGEFLERSILSVIEQDYPNKEFIVMDGGSTDGSVEIIKKYADNIDYWVSQPDGGQVSALIDGFSRAKGEIFCWLNSDDFFVADALKIVAEKFAKNPDAVAVAGACRLLDENGKQFKIARARNMTYEKIANWGEGWVFQPSCFFRSDAYREVGGLSTRFSLCFDMELWMKLSQRGRFLIIDDVLSEAVIHKDAKTQKQKAEMRAEQIMIQTVYGFDSLAKERLLDILKQGWFFQGTRIGRVLFRLYKALSKS